MLGDSNPPSSLPFPRTTHEIAKEMREKWQCAVGREKGEWRENRSEGVRCFFNPVHTGRVRDEAGRVRDARAPNSLLNFFFFLIQDPFCLTLSPNTYILNPIISHLFSLQFVLQNISNLFLKFFEEILPRSYVHESYDVLEM